GARSRPPAGPRASLHGAVRDVSPQHGLPGDDRDGSPPADPAARRRTGPRHLARDRGPRRRDPDADADRTADDADGAEDDGKEPRHGPWRAVLEWVAVIGCGVLIALAAQTFLVQAFWIPSPSMAPTLEVGDRVLVNKLAYRAHEVRRGDLVVFERPPNASNGQEDEIKDLIKRVIAVEGDTIEAYEGEVYVNGERIEEPYLAEGTVTENLPRQVVPEGKVFVMGDNRSNSEDSRVFGAIDEDTIIGC